MAHRAPVNCLKRKRSVVGRRITTQTTNARQSADNGADGTVHQRGVRRHERHRWRRRQRDVETECDDLVDERRRWQRRDGLDAASLLLLLLRCRAAQLGRDLCLGRIDRHHLRRRRLSSEHLIRWHTNVACLRQQPQTVIVAVVFAATVLQQRALSLQCHNALSCAWWGRRKKLRSKKRMRNRRTSTRSTSVS